MVLALSRMSEKVIQIRLYDVLDIMKGVRHRTLKSGTGILETERELFISESTPRKDKGRLVLISGRDINLVVARKAIHKRIYLTPSMLINELVNERCGVVIFQAGSVDIAIIDTDANSILLFIHRDNVRDPIYEWDRVNETSFKKFFNFRFDSCSLAGVHRA